MTIIPSVLPGPHVCWSMQTLSDRQSMELGMKPPVDSGRHDGWGCRAAIGLVMSCALSSCGGSPVEPSPTGAPSPTVPGVQRLTVSSPKSVLALGQTIQLRATVTLTDGRTRDHSDTAEWSSSNRGVVAVSSTGMVEAIGPGSVDTYAEYQGVRGTVNLRVERVVLSVSGRSVVTRGHTAQLRLIMTLPDGTTQDQTDAAAWSSSNTTVAAISNTGLVTGRQQGSADIRATHQDVSIHAPIRVELPRLELSGQSEFRKLGETAQLKLTATLADDTRVDRTSQADWQSSNRNVATVGQTGLVRAVGSGRANIAALYEGASARLTVTVTPPAESSPPVATPTRITVEAENGRGDGRIMSRSRASGRQTVLLLSGQTRQLPVSIRAEASYRVAVTYSNDNFGDTEVVRLTIDGVSLGTFRAQDTGDFGMGWNSFATAVVGSTLLSVGSHTVAIAVSGGDGFGVEIDKVELSP